MFSVHGLSRSGLAPVDFELAAGECVSVRGASGGGKTLLLRALADLDPNVGEVMLNGQVRAQVPAPWWRLNVAYVPAESGWWAERVGDHFDDWDAAASLLDRLRLPNAEPGWLVGRLSTGERQRLALVRAMLKLPRVLLLDEPTSGLDADAGAAVEALIGELLADGACALWVTHDARQATRISTRCLTVEGGVVSEGRP